VALDVEGTFDLFQDEDLLPKEIKVTNKKNWYAPFKKEKNGMLSKR